MVKFDNWDNTLKSIKDAENAVWQDSAAFNTLEIRSYLEGILAVAEAWEAKLDNIHQAIRDQTAI